jgi:hypothetical protein
MNSVQSNTLALISSSNTIIFTFWAYGASSLDLHGGWYRAGWALDGMLTSRRLLHGRGWYVLELRREHCHGEVACARGVYASFCLEPGDVFVFDHPGSASALDQDSHNRKPVYSES